MSVLEQLCETRTLIFLPLTVLFHGCHSPLLILGYIQIPDIFQAHTVVYEQSEVLDRVEALFQGCWRTYFTAASVNFIYIYIYSPRNQHFDGTRSLFSPNTKCVLIMFNVNCSNSN